MKAEVSLAYAFSSLGPRPACSFLLALLVLDEWGSPVATHPAVAAQLVAVVEALLLGQGEALPPLVEVAQSGVDLALIHAA